MAGLADRGWMLLLIREGAHLHGKDKNGRQRFRCRNAECRRTFNILTRTPMARTRKPETWGATSAT